MTQSSQTWEGRRLEGPIPSGREPVVAPLNDAALVLFSGGQDSTTCLAWALKRYTHVETVGFRYGQRHAVEMECRAPIREALACPAMGSDHVIDLTATIAGLGATAMTADIRIEMDQGGLPNTFVPGRNLLFLTCAAALAIAAGCTGSWRAFARRIIQATPTAAMTRSRRCNSRSIWECSGGSYWRPR